MSKKNATIQENYLKSGIKELCMSAAEKLAISIRGLAFKTLVLYSNRLLHISKLFLTKQFFHWKKCNHT